MSKMLVQTGPKSSGFGPRTLTLLRILFYITPLILHRTWSSCGNSRPCSRRRDIARRRWGRPGPTLSTWLSSGWTAAGSFSTVRFRYRYPYSAPHHFLSLSRETMFYVWQKKCTIFFSVVDAKSLYPDPDMGPVSAFQVNPDTAEKKLSYFDQKLQFAYLYCLVQVPLPVFCTPPFSFPCQERAMFYFRHKCTVFFSVVDAKSLYLHPDLGPVPAFQVNPDTAEKIILKVLSNGTGEGVWVVSIDRPLNTLHFRRF